MLASTGETTPPCRGPRAGLLHAPLSRPPRLQPLADHPTDHAVAYPTVEKGPQVAVVQLVKEAPDIHLQHPPTTQTHQLPPDIAEGIVSRRPRTQTVRAGQEVLFVDGFQHHHYGSLKHLVLQGRNPDRAGLGP